jgi:hypothetical protein
MQSPESVLPARTYARVAEKFSNPLTMSDDAREGLAEYWHYSFYRNCLYNRGYGFTGVTLPRATLAVDVGGVTYTNPFGGITLSLLPGTTLDRDNVLDVTYDYRLLRSSLVRGTTTVVLDVYVSDERITSFEDLEQNLAHIHTTQASTTQVAVRTTAAGTRYLAVDDGVYCGGVLMTPHKHIIDLYALCSTESYVETLIESVRFTQTSTSLY